MYNALRSGSVPIYMGAPNIGFYVPDRDSIIHVSDFESAAQLGDYLRLLASNRTMLVEKHMAWRMRPLPERLRRLTKLVDERSEHSFMCRVCNCFNGRIGCPNVTKVFS